MDKHHEVPLLMLENWKDESGIIHCFYIDHVKKTIKPFQKKDPAEIAQKK